MKETADKFVCDPFFEEAIEKWNKLGLCTFSKRCLKVVGFTGRGLRSFEITVVKGHRTIRVRTGSQPFENLTHAPVAPSSGRGVH